MQFFLFFFGECNLDSFFCEIFPLKVFEFKWMQMEKRYLSDITHANSALTWTKRDVIFIEKQIRVSGT